MRFSPDCNCCTEFTGTGDIPGGTCDYVSHCAPLLHRKFKLRFPSATWIGGCTAPGLSGCVDCSNMDGDPDVGFILEWEGADSPLGPCAWSCLVPPPRGTTNNCPEVNCPDRSPAVRAEKYFLILMGDGFWYLGTSLTRKWFWTVADADFQCDDVTSMASGEVVTEPCFGCDVFGGLGVEIEPFFG